MVRKYKRDQKIDRYMCRASVHENDENDITRQQNKQDTITHTGTTLITL